MPSLSIKDVPAALAEKLRQRAARNHRSLQGELMALLEAAVSEPVALAAAAPPGPAYAVAPSGMASAGAFAESGDLLTRLDAIVAGSQWGSGPVLTRDQANDRRLAREIEYERERHESDAA